MNAERAAKIREAAEHLLEAAQALESQDWNGLRCAAELVIQDSRILHLIDKKEDLI